jgi:hypothetical protein
MSRKTHMLAVSVIIAALGLAMIGMTGRINLNAIVPTNVL